MGIIKKLTEPKVSKRSITLLGCPFCDHLFRTEKAVDNHIEKKHGSQ